MDSGPASPSSSMLAGRSTLWRLSERRSRKAGSANIFSNVNLWQLQRLFRAAGDQDAEQRAQLIWGHGDEAELAKALIGLRARRTGRVGSSVVLNESQDPAMTPEKPVRSNSVLRRGGENKPERYLHRILH
uniref:Arginine vasopressin-induced protein 1 n=1 Tax=Maylandia zebra TaxID=106582 RepID=A0A3P9DR02_9CICH